MQRYQFVAEKSRNYLAYSRTNKLISKNLDEDDLDENLSPFCCLLKTNLNLNGPDGHDLFFKLFIGKS
jgi:hypothetical protein